ncbi:hypothetical protein [Teichococcus oryzae]|uniref:Uncharacterized protein n=1 Tax=Teichococcus oryzae TaxID=1608942 RepID=A0A5B2THG7_9PROT|nr:hypothetical protein [Pseudoroseomonas oryzae]KAA2213931.1 hypothetical protein F0Q34_07745 [Pseudoroseomonas oryzae]
MTPNPVLAGFLLVLLVFAPAASLVALLLSRASRFPGLAAGLVVVALIGLSWGGSVLLTH